jgi:uncharacterized protein (DUF2236 family)
MTWDHAADQLSRMYGSDVLTVGSQARELSRAVLAPRFSRMFPPVASWNRVVAVGLLPVTIRQRYGLAWSARDQRRFDRIVSRLRRVRQTLPDIVALWPEARA